MAELLSHHKISVQLTALFGLVQPAVPLVELKGLKKPEKRNGGGRPPSPPRPLICFMMQTPVLFHIGSSVTVAPRNKSSICNTSRCKGNGKI